MALALLSVIGFIRPAPAAAQPFAYIGTTGAYFPSHTCFLGYCPRSTLRVINTTTGHEIASVWIADSDRVSGVVTHPGTGRVYASYFPTWSPSGPPPEGRLSAVDVGTNQRVLDMPVGEYPTVRAVVADGSAVILTNGMAPDVVPSIRVVPTAGGPAILIPTGGSPTDVAAAPDGRVVYVAVATMNAVAVIDTRSWTVVTTVAVGAGPVSLALPPDGSRLYVANRNDGTVSVIDTTTHTVAAALLVGGSPQTLGVAGNGRLIVGSTDHLVVIDPTLGNIVGTLPLAVASIGRGAAANEVVATETHGAVTTIDAATPQVVRSFNSPAGPAAFGAAAGCVFEVGPRITAFRLSGGDGQIDVPAPSGCTWRADPGPEWLTFTSPAAGSGPGVITYTATIASEPRRTAIAIAGQSLAIVQGAPELVIEAPAPGATVVSPFFLAGWAITRDSTDPFCYGQPTCDPGVTGVSAVLVPQSGGNPVDLGPLPYGQERIDVAEQYGGFFRNKYVFSGFSTIVRGLPAGAYTLRVTSRSAFGSALDETRESTLTALKPCAAPVVSPTTVAVGPAASSTLVSVETNDPACSWTVTGAAPSWATVQNPGIVTGPGTVRIDVAANTTNVTREATVTVAGQDVSIRQTGITCTYVVSPTTILAGPGAPGWGTIVVLASGTGCVWTASSDVPWVTLGGGGTGSGTVSYRVQAWTGPVRTGVLTIAGVPIAIAQAPDGGTRLDRHSLAFASTGQSWTGSQTVTIAARPEVEWRASTYGGPVSVIPASGVGSGQVTVTLADGANLATGTGVLRIIDQWVDIQDVALRFERMDGSRPPVGCIDTPRHATVDVAGTIGVTGWAVDDVGVAGVRVYRSCVPFDPPAACADVAGRQVVFVGDATFVAGARPDVEAQFPDVPQAGRAAWGYLLLTNMLPHVPNQAMFGGQGAVTLHALATDVDGNQSWLAQPSDSQSVTHVTIMLANDTSTKPFGAIDTPAQGATVSGSIANFGWALTPDANTVAGDVGDIFVPTDGSTLRVYIDGVPGATIAYNQCRGTTASGPVPPGVYCDDDVASIFGHALPQATFTARTDNPTPHRNLDVGRGAIGALLIDTTTLTNGVHTIMWGITDSAGRGEGLGSRYFTVLNAGAAGLTAIGARRSAEDPLAVRGSRPSAEPATVRARTGLDLAPPWVTLEPDADGVRRVTIPVMGRVEIALGAGIEAAHLEVNGEPRALPPGSHLDTKTGAFAWAPSVGYLGTYRLVFERPDVAVIIGVVITP